jgi:[acyl-carrier-protein] S-malonyltransferase
VTALLFPGQGTARVGMGQALRMACPDATAAVLAQAGTLDAELADLMRHGPLSRLARTEHAQLAVTATNLSALAVLRTWPDSFSAVSGHSVGFLSALVGAGSLGVGAALRLARLRGGLMGSLPDGGAMASINGLPLEEVRDLTAQSARVTSATLVVGLVNGPSAIVVSGDDAAVDYACVLAAGRGARSTRLPVSHAFHSPLMRSVRDPWRDIVANEEFLAPAVSLIADLTGEIIDSPERIREVLVEQLTCAVRWELVSDRLAASAETEAVEVGDSTILRGFARSYPDLHVSSMAQPQVLARFRPVRKRLNVPAAAAARRGEESVND